ncbi:hypothetical protein IW147_006035 [Coemansia sp. RSA 720]|nr:hypothetical protein IW147_006035 [Coemansia sp. RSA 720]
MPLIGCLRLFDPSLSTVTVRSLPNITDWSVDDLSTLKSLVTKQFSVLTADGWSLVSVYMNVAQSDCFMAHMCTNPRMTPDLHEAITRHRNDGLTWWDILKKYPLYSNTSGLRDVYRRFKERDGSKPKAKIIKWSDEETRRIKEIIQAYYKPENWRELLTQAQMTFPNRTEASILGKIEMTICKTSDITNNDLDRVNKLVEAYGKDWERIGQEIDTIPQRVQRIWTLYQQQQKPTQAWTDDELDILRKCIRDGVGMAEASQLIGTKTPHMCNAKMKSLKRQGAKISSQKSNTPWIADDVARLEHLVSTYKGRKFDWMAIGKDIGRTADSCQNKHIQLKQDPINSMVDHSQTVSYEVQKQYEQQPSVNWTGIAHMFGLTERQCLEANQYNVGKARWIYHPDTFSWDMANRMTAFIKDNYPKPLPVNYTAVSNYMWIDINDYVKMASLLRGKMVWTAETFAQVVKLREQDMLYKDIARQLSPALSTDKISVAYRNRIKPKVYMPLSYEEKQQIKEIIDMHVEQMPFTELQALVMQKMAHANQQALYSFVNSYSTTLSVYKERLRNADTDQIASQILNGTKSSKLVVQLGIPSTILTRLMKSNMFSMHS